MNSLDLAKLTRWHVADDRTHYNRKRFGLQTQAQTPASGVKVEALFMSNLHLTASASSNFCAEHKYTKKNVVKEHDRGSDCVLLKMSLGKQYQYHISVISRRLGM